MKYILSAKNIPAMLNLRVPFVYGALSHKIVYFKLDYHINTPE